MRKWKCVEVGNKNEWTTGKIYETGDDGNGLVSDGGSTGWVQPWNFSLGKAFGAKFEEVTQFTKADLKPCMVVVQRSGDIKIVAECKNGMVIVNKDGIYGGLEYYNKDMICCDGLNDFDIMQVYGFSVHSYAANVISIENRPLLWERIEKSPTQIKLEELEQKQREIANEIKKIREEME